MARKKGDGVTIVVKKYEEGGGGHHGGAWKVAYADFVTAMMAFFLLMWLLNATTEEQRRGLADYFAPSNALSSGSSGMGQPFGGTTMNSVGQMARDAGAIRAERGHNPTRLDIEDESDELEQPPTAPRQGPPGEAEEAQRTVAMAQPGQPGGGRQGTGRDQGAAQAAARDSDAARLTDMALRAELARREQAAMEQAADQLREEIRQNPATAEMAQQVSVEITPEGLRIQLIDADGQAMFTSGSAQPNDRTRALIRAVALAAARLPNPIQITGHTDSVPFRGEGRSNWELSAERANAARRLLTEAGVADQRFRAVTGAADRDLHIPDNPQAAGNRRVAITMLRLSDAPRATPTAGDRAR